MGRIAVFIDAGYFWVQSVHIVLGKKTNRDHISVNYPSMRSEFLEEIKSQFPDCSLLRIYWYDGPGAHGKASSHVAVEELDDFKLRMGTRNGAGDQKAVDGLIIADLIGLAQSKSISDALLISGDADLTPGVQAAQSLGIRVHLLSMGPINATSPYLKAEVDQKKHWDDTTVKKFISANLQLSNPPPVAAILPPSAIVSTPQLGADTSNTVTTATVSDQLKQAAKAFYDATSDKTQIPKSGTIPSHLDSQLLTVARKTLARSLTDNEKIELRGAARTLAV